MDVNVIYYLFVRLSIWNLTAIIKYVLRFAKLRLDVSLQELFIVVDG